MSEYSSNYEGLNWTDKYLTVTYTTGNGPSKRFRHVKVPMVDLLSSGIQVGLNRLEAVRLQEYWEEGQPPLPIGEPQ